MGAEMRRDDYRYFMPIPIRWNDNDMLGHVNNAVYYTYFEQIVVGFDEGILGLDWDDAPVIPVVVESLCRFRRPLSYPGTVEAAMRIDKLGNSSVRYGVGLFMDGDATAAADGYMVQVYVDRQSNRPVPIPGQFRSLYERYT